MAKKIYFETVKSKLIAGGITGGTAIGAIFVYLILIGAISNVTFTGDTICAGTIEDPCIAFINFTANEDIFIYPLDYDPWGRNTPFEFEPNVKEWHLYRSWGTSWREINLTKTCIATWCGAPPNSPDNKYAFAFRKGRDYQLKLVILKHNSTQNIKWGAFDGQIDPYFLTDNPDEINKKRYDEESKKITIDNNLTDIAEITLKSPQINYVNIGYQKVAEFWINNSVEYPTAFKEMQFYDRNNNNLEINRNFDYKYFVPGTKNVTDRTLICEDKEVLIYNNQTGENDTVIRNICELNITGSHIENTSNWIDLNTENDLPIGLIKVGIFTNVKPGDRVEWQPTLFGLKIDEWAEWYSANYTYRRNITGLYPDLILPINTSASDSGSNQTDIDGDSINETIYASGDSDTSIYYGNTTNNQVANGTTEFWKVQTMPSSIQTGSPHVNITGFFPLDNQTLGIDYVNSSINLTYFGTNFTNEGIFGGQLFSGSGGLGGNSISYTGSSPFEGKQGTIAIWNTPDFAAGAATTAAFVAGTVGGSDKYLIYHASGTLRVYLGPNGEKVLQKNPSGWWNANELMRILLTWDTDTDEYRIYINKDRRLDEGNTDAGGPSTSTNPTAFLLGNGASGAYNYDGSISHVIVYDRVLTNQEINDTYDMGALLGAQEQNYEWTSDLNNGLTAFWNYDQQAPITELVDVANGTHNGTITSIESRNITGIINYSYEFDGINDLITIQNPSDFDCNTHTISVWVNWSSVSSYQAAFSKRPTGLSDIHTTFTLYKEVAGTDRLTYVIGTGGSANYVEIPNFEWGDWHHLVLTYNNNTGYQKIYVDSVLNQSEQPNFASLKIGGTFLIGNHGNHDYDYEGLLDEMGFWCDVELNTSQIAALYNNGNGITYPLVPINDTTAPDVEIVYPSNTTYASAVTELNYTVSDNIGLSSCWWTNNSGATNYTITCGQNVTTSSEVGSNTWIVYANDTNGNRNSSQVTFEIGVSLGVVLNSPLDTTISPNLTYNFTATIEGINLVNATLYTWDNNSLLVNKTTNPVTGTGTNITTFLNVGIFTTDNYTWNVYGCNDLNCTFNESNFTFETTSDAILLSVTPNTLFEFFPANSTDQAVEAWNQSINTSTGALIINNTIPSNIDIKVRLNEINLNITLKLANNSNYSTAISVNTSWQTIYYNLQQNQIDYIWAWADYNYPNTNWTPNLDIRGIYA